MAIIKDSLFIDNALSVNFWNKVMDMANYLYSELSIRCKSPIFISKEVWTNIKLNLEHIYIFGNRVSTFISSKKHTKLDVQKTWKDIFKDYIKISKHVKIWAFYIYQVFIPSKLIVNMSNKGANLLKKYLLPLSN